MYVDEKLVNCGRSVVVQGHRESSVIPAIIAGVTDCDFLSDPVPRVGNG
jgi:hypothetical protein